MLTKIALYSFIVSFVVFVVVKVIELVKTIVHRNKKKE